MILEIITFLLMAGGFGFLMRRMFRGMAVTPADVVGACGVAAIVLMVVFLSSCQGPHVDLPMTVSQKVQYASAGCQLLIANHRSTDTWTTIDPKYCDYTVGQEIK